MDFLLFATPLLRLPNNMPQATRFLFQKNYISLSSPMLPWFTIKNNWLAGAFIYASVFMRGFALTISGWNEVWKGMRQIHVPTFPGWLWFIIACRCPYAQFYKCIIFWHHFWILCVCTFGINPMQTRPHLSVISNDMSRHLAFRQWHRFAARSSPKLELGMTKKCWFIWPVRCGQAFML